MALCIQQSEASGPSRRAGKGSSNKGYLSGQRKFSGKRKGKGRVTSQRSGRGGSPTGRAASNGGRKGAGLVRPMTGKNRY